MSEFEKKWEKFRLDNDIPCETFVASGYGFVEDLEDFFSIQFQEYEAKFKELNKRTADAELGMSLLITENKTFVADLDYYLKKIEEAELRANKAEEDLGRVLNQNSRLMKEMFKLWDRVDEIGK